MLSLERSGYTADEIQALLHATNRLVTFRYDLYSKDGSLKGPLNNVIAASVSHNYLSQINRTARFTMRDDGSVDFSGDHIKPYVRFKVNLPIVGALRVAFSMQDIGADTYCYAQTTDPGNYILQAGDVVEYDLWWDVPQASIAFDFRTADGWNFRDSGAKDQNGYGPHAQTKIPGPLVYRRWYSRKLPVPASGVGKAIDTWYFACEQDSPGLFSAAVRNVRITDGNGTVRKVVLATGGYTPTFTVSTVTAGSTVRTFSVLPKYVEFPLGVFLLSSPTRKILAEGVTREVEAYDFTQILLDDKITTRYTVRAGDSYTGKLAELLAGAGFTSNSITPSSRTLPADRDWVPGTTKLQIINDLLAAINYLGVWFNENGWPVCEPYLTPDQRPLAYTYADDEQSVILPQADQAVDYFKVPNKWVLVVSHPDLPVMITTYTNQNPESHTSTVGRGRTIVAEPCPMIVEAATQADLDALAKKVASDASQVYETVTFTSAIMPMHSNGDILQFDYAGAGISAKYLEVSWSFSLQAGATMQHQIRRLVYV